MFCFASLSLSCLPLDNYWELRMPFSFLSLNFWKLIGSQNTSVLAFLRWLKLISKNLIDFLDQYNLKNKNITYVKDEGSNLNVTTTTLKFVVSCETMGLKESFEGTCFDHAFFIVYFLHSKNINFCQYIIIHLVYKIMPHVTIVWPKFQFLWRFSFQFQKGENEGLCLFHCFLVWLKVHQTFI
jgi:hypothetical protein